MDDDDNPSLDEMEAFARKHASKEESTSFLLAMTALPLTHKLWQSCPFPPAMVKQVMLDELKKRQN